MRQHGGKELDAGGVDSGSSPPSAGSVELKEPFSTAGTSFTLEDEKHRVQG